MDQIEQELRDLLAEIEEDLESLPRFPVCPELFEDYELNQGSEPTRKEGE